MISLGRLFQELRTYRAGTTSTSLRFTFRSGTNEESGENDDRPCKLYGDECECVVHVL